MAKRDLKRGQSRAETQRERDLQVVAQMYSEGATYSKIAQTLGVSPSTVSNDVARLRKQWREQRLLGFEAAVVDELERLSTVQEEAWAAWRRSIGTTISTTRRTTRLDKDRRKALGAWLERYGTGLDEFELVVGMDAVHVTEEIQDSAGDPQFLRIVIECSRERRKLLGLDAPERMELYRSAEDPTQSARDSLLEKLFTPLQSGDEDGVPGETRRSDTN